MKRLAPLAVVVCTCAAACGSGSSTTVVLRPVNPVLANVYVAITGAKADAATVATGLRPGQSPFPWGGFIAAPAAQGRAFCTFGPHFAKADRVKVTVYGTSDYARTVCRQFKSGYPIGISTTYTVPSSSMEPTLHCAKPRPGCLGVAADRVLVKLTGGSGLQRDDIVVFDTPHAAAVSCGEGGTFVKRIIGLPGETVREDGQGYIWIRGPDSKKFVKLDEPYISAQARELDTGRGDQSWKVPEGDYFVMGDNRSESCDSRQWGSVPPHDVIGVATEVLRGGALLKPAGVQG